jgi:hypothetical protein
MTAEVGQAIQLIKSGNKMAGARILAELVLREPRNETAWLWLAVCAPTVKHRCDCLRRVLAINPDHHDAREALAQLEMRGEISEEVPSLIELTEDTPVNPTAVTVIQMPTEPTWVTLTCPSCGADLQVADEKGSSVPAPAQDEGKYRCSHCGSEHLLRRDAGKLFLEPLLQTLEKVQSGVERATAELAQHRLQDEIQLLSRRQVTFFRRASEAGKILLTGIFLVLIYLTMVNFSLFLWVGLVLIAGGGGVMFWWLRMGWQMRREVEARRAKADQISDMQPVEEKSGHA